MSADRAADIWNRALDYDDHPTLEREGDQALRYVLTFHGSVMNGGLLNAVQSYQTDDEFPLARIVDAYEWLGLAKASSAITTVAGQAAKLNEDDAKAWEKLEHSADDAYGLEDEDIDQSFQRVLRSHPEAFQL